MERPDESTAPDADASDADTDPSDAARTPDLPAVAEALVGCVAEALERGEAPTVPGLGAFHVEQRDSEWVEADDGSASLTPPRREIVFDSARSTADASTPE